MRADDEAAGESVPKFENVYISEGIGQPTVFIYVPEGDWQFLVEADGTGKVSGLNREFRHEGTPHRIAIAVTEGKVESVRFDDRVLTSTALSRDEIEALRKAAYTAAEARKVVVDPAATDADRLAGLHQISEVIKSYPFLASPDEPANLARYSLRAFEGVTLELHNIPIEVQVPLLNAQGQLVSVHQEFPGGHALDVKCSEIEVLAVEWDGRRVLPAYPNRIHFVLPPGLLLAVSLDGAVRIQCDEAGRIRHFRFSGGTILSKKSQVKAYYEVEDYYPPDLVGPLGKFVTVFRPEPPGAEPVKRMAAPPEAGATARKSEPVPAPIKPPLRLWSDSSGKFSVQASLLEVRGDQVILQRADGKRLEVPISRLSADDQRYLRTPAR